MRTTRSFSSPSAARWAAESSAAAAPPSPTVPHFTTTAGRSGCCSRHPSGSGQGAATDNFHTGGIAYPLELVSGRVSGPGRNNTDLGDYTRHPASGAYLPGFQIPFWPELIACVRRAMDRVPGMGYVGWDIAVTPDGPELIEGNWHWPGGNIIQFDGVGKYPLLRDCAGETDEEHPH